MSTGPDPPAEAEDSTATGESTSTEVDQAESAAALADRRVRGKRRLLDLTKDGLAGDTRRYSVARVLDDVRVLATFDADGVTADGGKPGVVGEFLLSLQRLVDTLGGGIVMRELAFGSSVIVELEPVVPADKRELAAELAREAPDAKLDQRELRELIPDSVAAVAAATRLLASPGDEALVEARRFGAEVPDAYLRLARVVDRDRGTVTIRTRIPVLDVDGQEATIAATLTGLEARRALARAGETEALRPIPITIAGRLTRTDSEEAMFRVVLDRNRIPPELDARRRHVDGAYTGRASKQVRDDGLWDQRVVAKVRAFPVRSPLRSKPTYDRFQFTDVRRAAARSRSSA